MDTHDEWTVVKSKKKNKFPNGNKSVTGTTTLVNLSKENTIKLIEEIESNLIVHINEFSNKSVDRLNRHINCNNICLEEQKIQFIVLGLGSPTKFRSSREQIIVAEQIFKRIAPNSILEIITLDPAFTEDDKEVIYSRNNDHIEWTIIDDSDSVSLVPEVKDVSLDLLNEVTKGLKQLFFPCEADISNKNVDEYEDQLISSIIYAPHCPKALYTCLESAFWMSRDDHNYLCIFGNIPDEDNLIPCYDIKFPKPLAQDLNPIENNHRAPLFQSQSGLGWRILEKL